MDQSGYGGDIYRLPEGFISHIISLTTPRDACRSSLVSSTFRSAASSDTVWDRFLPSDWEEILTRAVDPVEFSSKKELYFRLCDSILIDGCRKSFRLERESGRKCYMLGARELSIIWGDEPRYWRWVSLPDSRFVEVAELLAVCWLEICGRIDSRVLSPKTSYAAYLIFKVAGRSSGLRSPSKTTSVKVGNNVSEHTVRLQSDEHLMGQQDLIGLPALREAEGTEELPQTPVAREDGWMEIEMGEFFNDEGDDGEVEMSLKEARGIWKKGLIIQGIELRPKN